MAVALASACGSEATAPPAKSLLRLTLAISNPSVVVVADSSGPVGVSCVFTIEGSATGDTPATWRRVGFRVFGGTSRSTPIYVDSLSASEALQAYGPLTARSDYATRWTLSFNRPFYVEMTHVFAPGGPVGVDSVTIAIPCGQAWATPTPPAPPTLSAIYLSTVGAVAAGGTVDVTYTLNAPAGAWRSDVVLTGGCSVDLPVVENLQFAITRTVHVPLPASCGPPAALHAAVYSVDAAGRGVVDTAGPAPVLRDTTPPSITLDLESDSSGAASAYASPTLVQGDTAYLRLTSADAGTLARVSWTASPFGVRDSVPLGATADLRSIRVPLPPGFLGTVQANAAATDKAGNRTTTPDQLLPVLPRTPGSVVSTTLRGPTFDIALDDVHERVYVLGRGTDGTATWLFAYSAFTLALEDSLRVADNTVSLMLAKDASALYAYKDRQHVLRVDLAAPRLAYTAFDSTDFLLRGTSLVALANGMLAFVKTSPTTFPVILAMRGDDGSVSPLVGAPNLVGTSIFASGDGRFLFVKTNPTVWTRMDIATGQLVAVTAPEFATTTPEPDPSGARLRIAGKTFDVATGATGTLPLAPTTRLAPFVLTPDWRTQYLGYRNGVVGVQQLTTGGMDHYIGVPRWAASMLMSPTGRRIALMYATGGGSNLALLSVP
ncbi:MAG: hypothetical protein HY275_02145 [Gemmatimonadetes bacterium]|nr:hypothetical protein [Gemmatimonadota bacterium]